MIDLKKGSSISLEKDGKALDFVYVGLNWGAIKVFMGLFSQNVDLDGSVTMFNANKDVVDTVYYRKKISDDKSIKHSGDDLTGDTSKDDKDNEVISINLKKVSNSVTSIVVYLNSFNGKDFDSIPYANIRLLDGVETSYKKAFASFKLSSDPKFKDKVSMVMAKLVRVGKGWEFHTIGEPVDTKKIPETIELIRAKYL
jgi:tellurium resistance protein TerZ